MRKQEEIIKRIVDVREEDIFGTELGDLIGYLDYENAKQYLKEGVNEEDWNKNKNSTDEEILGEMKDYISFAWNKARGERGLSASRNLMHYSAWIWLLDDGNFEEFLEMKGNNFSMYGKPVLSWICKKYGFKDEEEGED